MKVECVRSTCRVCGADCVLQLYWAVSAVQKKSPVWNGVAVTWSDRLPSEKFPAGGQQVLSVCASRSRSMKHQLTRWEPFAAGGFPPLTEQESFTFPPSSATLVFPVDTLLCTVTDGGTEFKIQNGIQLVQHTQISFDDHFFIELFTPFMHFSKMFFSPTFTSITASSYCPTLKKSFIFKTNFKLNFQERVGIILMHLHLVLGNIHMHMKTREKPILNIIRLGGSAEGINRWGVASHTFHMESDCAVRRPIFSFRSSRIVRSALDCGLVQSGAQLDFERRGHSNSSELVLLLNSER